MMGKSSCYASLGKLLLLRLAAAALLAACVCAHRQDSDDHDHHHHNHGHNRGDERGALVITILVSVRKAPYDDPVIMRATIICLIPYKILYKNRTLCFFEYVCTRRLTKFALFVYTLVLDKVRPHLTCVSVKAKGNAEMGLIPCSLGTENSRREHRASSYNTT